MDIYNTENGVIWEDSIYVLGSFNREIFRKGPDRGGIKGQSLRRVIGGYNGMMTYVNNDVSLHFDVNGQTKRSSEFLRITQCTVNYDKDIFIIRFWD